MSEPIATLEFAELDPALEFIKRTRWELRELWRVRVWKDRLQILDVNLDYFELRGVGYTNEEIVPLLRAVNTAFDPLTVSQETTQEYKEFKTGRRFPWAADRAM